MLSSSIIPRAILTDFMCHRDTQVDGIWMPQQGYSREGLIRARKGGAVTYCYRITRRAVSLWAYAEYKYAGVGLCCANHLYRWQLLGDVDAVYRLLDRMVFGKEDQFVDALGAPISEILERSYYEDVSHFLPSAAMAAVGNEAFPASPEVREERRLYVAPGMELVELNPERMVACASVPEMQGEDNATDDCQRKACRADSDGTRAELSAVRQRLNEAEKLLEETRGRLTDAERQQAATDRALCLERMAIRQTKDLLSRTEKELRSERLSRTEKEKEKKELEQTVYRLNFAIEDRDKELKKTKDLLAYAERKHEEQTEELRRMYRVSMEQQREISRLKEDLQCHLSHGAGTEPEVTDGPEVPEAPQRSPEEKKPCWLLRDDFLLSGLSKYRHCHLDWLWVILFFLFFSLGSMSLMDRISYMWFLPAMLLSFSCFVCWEISASLRNKYYGYVGSDEDQGYQRFLRETLWDFPKFIKNWIKKKFKKNKKL